MHLSLSLCFTGLHLFLCIHLVWNWSILPQWEISPQFTVIACFWAHMIVFACLWVWKKELFLILIKWTVSASMGSVPTSLSRSQLMHVFQGCFSHMTVSVCEHTVPSTGCQMCVKACVCVKIFSAAVMVVDKETSKRKDRKWANQWQCLSWF